MKWEYNTQFNPSQKTMASMGKDGWELVSVDDGRCYFKRPLDDDERYR